MRRDAVTVGGGGRFGRGELLNSTLEGVYLLPRRLLVTSGRLLVVVAVVWRIADAGAATLPST